MTANEIVAAVDALKVEVESRCTGHPDPCPCQECLALGELYDSLVEARHYAAQMDDRPMRFMVFNSDNEPADGNEQPRCLQEATDDASYFNRLAERLFRNRTRYHVARVDAQGNRVVAKRTSAGAVAASSR